ncbi:hypothetical protein [Acinetobacter indicus]|uniref:hypothetical protein n=1 Tax=Acinetobacter indicus TaxID=756892 RepID=UPI0034CD6181
MRDKQIIIRLSSSELSELKALVKQSGQSQSDFIRGQILSSSGSDLVTIQELRIIGLELKKFIPAHNMNLTIQPELEEIRSIIEQIKKLIRMLSN